MRREIKRIELLLLTYSDGVSSSYQSHLAANPLLCFLRKKEAFGGRSGSVRRDKVYLHSGGSYGTRREPSNQEPLSAQRLDGSDEETEGRGARCSQVLLNSEGEQSSRPIRGAGARLFTLPFIL